MSILAGDFNGDGKLDLALGTQPSALADGNSGRLRVLLSRGDGTFAPVSSSSALGTSPTAIASGDFNADGKLDLAVANFRSNNISILLGKGDGTFAPAPASPLAAGGAPSAVKVCDFNRDGRPDLIFVNSSSNNAVVLLGNGDGTFAPAPASPLDVGSSALGLALADFDGDGNPDLAVTNLRSDTVTIRLGKGDGTFKPASRAPMPVGSHPAVLAPGDFNGDGKADLAIAGYVNDSVSILLGKGDGTFTAAPACCGAPKPQTRILAMIAADFNRTGKPDLVLAVQNGQAGRPAAYVTALMGVGDGTFIASDFSLLVPNDAVSLAASDFNGDGKLDIAAAHNPYAQVSVLLHAQPPGNGPDFAIAARGSTSASVQPGGTASFPVRVSSLNGFIGRLLLSCSGAPRQSSCSIAPSSDFLFDTAWGDHKLSVTTMPSSPEPSGGTPPGTYALTVTATSGSRAHSTTVTLTVE